MYSHRIRFTLGPHRLDRVGESLDNREVAPPCPSAPARDSAHQAEALGLYPAVRPLHQHGSRRTLVLGVYTVLSQTPDEVAQPNYILPAGANQNNFATGHPVFTDLSYVLQPLKALVELVII